MVKYIASDNQQISKLGTYVGDAGIVISFDVYDNTITSILEGKRISYPKNKWIKADDYCDLENPYSFESTIENYGYVPGFHVEKTKTGVKTWTGRKYKVACRGLIETGTQNGFPVGVFREIKILGEI